MPALCHRCHRDLPVMPTASQRGEPETRDDLLLFCPHCAAPQIRLPEYNRTPQPQADMAQTGLASTGATPPPLPLPGVNPGVAVTILPAPAHVEWRVALRLAAAIALAAALTNLVSIVGGASLIAVIAAFAGQLLLFGGSVLVVGLYASSSPRAHLSLRRGLSIGLVTGLLMVVAGGLTLGAAGVIARFLVHSGEFDAEIKRSFLTVQQAWTSAADGQPDMQKAQQYLAAKIAMPEGRAGMALLGGGYMSLIVVAISAAGGAAAGFLRTPRQRQPR